MNKKKPVTFQPVHVPRYAHDKLRLCRHCGRYTALSEEKCTNCGKGRLSSVEQQAVAITGRSMSTRLLIVLFLTLVSVYFGNDFRQMALCAAGGLALLALLYYTQRRVRPAENLRSLNELLGRNIDTIKEGLEINRQEAVSVLRENDVLAYEKLRELSILLRGDRIARQRVALLHGFLLRKDMDLEMEQLLLKDFEPLLAEYIGEIAKVRNDLIKDRTFRYVLTYEEQILRMDKGAAILAGVAGAAVRMKRYSVLYSAFISRYVHDLPRDRVLRLARLISANPYEPWNGLDDRVGQIMDNKYHWDPDFQ